MIITITPEDLETALATPKSQVYACNCPLAVSARRHSLSDPTMGLFTMHTEDSAYNVGALGVTLRKLYDIGQYKGRRGEEALQKLKQMLPVSVELQPFYGPASI